jgi:PBP1b-binding outer membrane lipoprotein LpoB
MKTKLIFKAIMLLMVAAFLNSCSKNGDNNAKPAPSTGDFISNSTTYTGPCTSVPDVGTGGAAGNIDALIVTTSGTSFIVYNMPQQSSGTFNFTDGYNNVGSSSLYGIFTLASNNTEYATRSGTVTKTGSNSFTFSCTVYDIISGQSLTVTGKGAY